MATQSFFIMNTEDTTEDTQADAVVKGKDKALLGEAYRKEAPSGRKYLVVKLKDYWIITNEEYKKLCLEKRKAV